MVTSGTEAAERYRLLARVVTSVPVLHRDDKKQQVDALPWSRRKRGAAELRDRWAVEESAAADAAVASVWSLQAGARGLRESTGELATLGVPDLLGKAEVEVHRLDRVIGLLEDAASALRVHDFGEAGERTEEAMRELALSGGPLVVALNGALARAAVGKAARDELSANLEERRAAQGEVERLRTADPQDRIAAAVRLYDLQAEGMRIAANVLRGQVRAVAKPVRRRAGTGKAIPVLGPAELETFADVGGLDDVKETLRATIGAILERPDEAARYRVVHNGILFHGPPGTGKTLLSRALAGEYGLHYMRFSPSAIGSSAIHEAAANLEQLFDLARRSTPCVLFLDEIDVIAAHRTDQPSADHREVVTQLMNCLEEYRTVPGLVICAATNDIDRLDPGLREGRFDAKILVPLPPHPARVDVLRVHLEHRDEAVAWDDVDLEQLADLTAGRNAAALEGFVSAAAQRALQAGTRIDQQLLVEAVRDREGRDRVELEERLGWDDVVLPDDCRSRLTELLNAFAHPEQARALGVRAPAGLLLHGPPGTGKTTVAKVLAGVCEASFYEVSAADLLSKWSGESEQKVARLFERARANRPTIVFVDEADGLLRRRGVDSAAPWEERVVNQFLRELDGLRAGEGVLLVAATNRVDVIDDAIVNRRLVPVEIGLPSAEQRRQLFGVLCRSTKLAKDVDLDELADSTEGMSGADIRRLRDTAGLKALSRAVSSTSRRAAAVSMADFRAALDSQREQASLAQV